MALGESSKHVIGHSSSTSSGETAMHASTLIISLVKEAAAIAPCVELKQAAAVALVIFETIQAVKDNKEAYKRLGDDSGALIVAIWKSFKKAESAKEWLSADMQEILVELTQILNHICAFVREKLARNKAMRVIYSRADGGKIAEYRENLNAALQKFEFQSHMNIDLKLGKIEDQIRYRNGEDIRRVLEISAREARQLEEKEKIQKQEVKVVKRISTLEHLNQIEIDDDEQEHSEESKKHEKGKDRQSELERLRAAARAVEAANRLKKLEAEEEEMAELRRKIAASRRSAQPGKHKRSSTRDDESEDENEQEKLGRKANPRRSPHGAGPHGTLESFTDDEDPLRKSKTGTARWKLSRTPTQSEDTDEQSTDDQSTDDEQTPPPKKDPKVGRKPQIPPGTLPREVDDLMAQFQRFGTPLGGSPHGSRSGSPMNYQPYGYPSPPSVAPNVYGGGVPGYSPHGSGTSTPMYYPPYGYPYPPPMAPGSVVNTGSGNITNSTISNVGNDNSVQKVYRAPRNRRTLRTERN